MNKNKIKILLFVKSDFHELLITKEIRFRLNDPIILCVSSKKEAIQLISTENINAIIVDINSEIKGNICEVHQIYLYNSDIPIIALVDDNTEKFTKNLHEFGVTEVLQKNNDFYVSIPYLIKKVLSFRVNAYQNRSLGQNIGQAEHLKLTSRTLAHEINNPLMAILGLAELILDEKVLYDRKLIKKIKVIQKSALRIQQSTHRMSHISTPVFQKTPNGKIIDPKKSRIYTKAKV